MKCQIFIPESVKDAGENLRLGLAYPIDQLPRREFVRAWSSIAYLSPGFNPDDYDICDSGWPRVVVSFAKEAVRRFEAGDIEEGEFYPSDAQWSGLYDRMTGHTTDEVSRRRELADHSLACANG